MRYETYRVPFALSPLLVSSCRGQHDRWFRCSHVALIDRKWRAQTWRLTLLRQRKAIERPPRAGRSHRTLPSTLIVPEPGNGWQQGVVPLWKGHERQKRTQRLQHSKTQITLRYVRWIDRMLYTFEGMFVAGYSPVTRL